MACGFIGACCRAMDKQEALDRLNRHYTQLQADEQEAVAKRNAAERLASHLQADLDNKKKILDLYDKCCSDKHPQYYVEVCGKIYYVTRRSNGICTTIKVFDTDDAVYNGNCAHELLDSLNEELCYD